ncbi:MAG: hypothetical protein CL846_08560 [Crocinitomicaceae bacterium]|nr:hypothetical protein [Crocinitomicaceae bacterium]|tara:strand:+ start:414 stop:779 length:366 start_codon:yes stop_codon:yes gene_type:complete
MKKIIYSALLSGFFFMSTNVASAQHVFVNDQDINELDIQYVELRVGSALNPTKVRVYVDYGQAFSLKRQLIMTADKKPVKFNSAVHALNFMDKNGWDYIEIVAVQAGETTTFKYVMQKTKE